MFDPPGWPPQPRCDFCVGIDPQWSYRATPFEIPGPRSGQVYIDDGEWSACEACMLSVTDRDVDAMVERTLANLRMYALPELVTADEQKVTRDFSERVIRAFLVNMIEGPYTGG